MWVVSNNFFSRTQVLNQKTLIYKKRSETGISMCMAAHI